MSIFKNVDGSLILTGDVDPTRSQIVPAGTAEIQHQAIEAFFKLEPVDQDAIAKQDVTQKIADACGVTVDDLSTVLGSN